MKNYIDRVLRNHFPYCKLHEYSLQEDRHCSCGIEGARKEWGAVLEVLDALRPFALHHLDIPEAGDLVKKIDELLGRKL